VAGRERLILALDVPDLATARLWIERLAPTVGVFKVGLELFTAAGPSAVAAVHEAGAQCFLDLKLHDIPKTVSSAVSSACELGVRYLTLHASAGPACLGAAAESAAGSSTQLLAVTVLTSMDEAEIASVGYTGSVEKAVHRLAKLAVDHGIDGLVCSPRECGMLRRNLGAGPHLVVPGVRPAGASTDDQRRIATPTQAILDGANALVVGRPIRNAEDPVQAAKGILREIEGASDKAR